MDKIKKSVAHYSNKVASSRVGTTVQSTWSTRIGKFGIIFGAFMLAYVLYSTFGPEETMETVVVKAGGSDSVVSIQGAVEPAREVELGFESTGKVSWVGVKVGDTVRAGQALATLTQGDLSAQIASLVATRDAAKAKLEELKRGTRTEEIAIAESQVAAAKNTVTQAESTLIDTLSDGYIKADDAVRAKTDPFFTNPRSTFPQLNQPTDSQLKVQIENARLSLEQELTAMQSSSVPHVTQESISLMKTRMYSIRSYLDQMATFVNLLQSYSALPQTTVDGYRTVIFSARTSISAYITALTTAENAYNTAKSSLATADSQLTQKKAGPSKEDIAAQEASVRAANANIAATQALSAKRSIIAPFAGLITKVEPKVGSIVGSTSVIALISNNQLQVESYVPEVYIAKIAKGDKAEITLDAYGSQNVFSGSVVMIEPSSTVKDGVSTYKILITFDVFETKIRPGMGGDVTITGSKGIPVITIPKKSVISRNGKNYVQVPAGNNRVIEREIIVAKFNEANNAEITEGLTDGDEIVVNPIQ